jgi:hypothetical protein
MTRRSSALRLAATPVRSKSSAGHGKERFKLLRSSGRPRRRPLVAPEISKYGWVPPLEKGRRKRCWPASFVVLSSAAVLLQLVSSILQPARGNIRPDGYPPWGEPTAAPHFLAAAVYSGVFMLMFDPASNGPAELESGKFGTPFARMQLAIANI